MTDHPGESRDLTVPPGFVLVRTNGMVPDGVYELDTSADGFYLVPLAYHCENCGAPATHMDTEGDPLCGPCWRALPPESCNRLDGHAGPCGAPDCWLLGA